MAHKATDVVVLLMKSRDGKTVNRVNAIVLHSRVQPDGAEKLSPKEVEKRRLLKGPMGKPIAGGEYLDVAYPDPALSSINGGEHISSRDASVIFRFAYTVPKYTDGAAIGWEEFQGEDLAALTDTYVAAIKSLRDSHDEHMESPRASIEGMKSSHVSELSAKDEKITELLRELADTTEGRDKALQALADEKKAKDATSGEQSQDEQNDSQQ